VTATTWVDFASMTLQPGQSVSKTYRADQLGPVCIFWPKVFGPCLVTITRADTNSETVGDPEDPALRIPYGSTSFGIQGEPVVFQPTGGAVTINVRSRDAIQNTFGWLLEAVDTRLDAASFVLPYVVSRDGAPGNVNAGARATIADFETPTMTRLVGIATCTQAFTIEADWSMGYSSGAALTTWTETLFTGAAGAVGPFDVMLRSAKVLVAVRNTAAVAGTASGTARALR
jgi:hypothetical protein